MHVGFNPCGCMDALASRTVSFLGAMTFSAMHGPFGTWFGLTSFSRHGRYTPLATHSRRLRSLRVRSGSILHRGAMPGARLCRRGVLGTARSIWDEVWAHLCIMARSLHFARNALTSFAFTARTIWFQTTSWRHARCPCMSPRVSRHR